MRSFSAKTVEALLTVGWLSTGVASVTSGLAMAGRDWAPVADNGLIAAMTVDSFSLQPPLLGMPTSLGFEDGAPLSHLGPLGFWMLAVPTKLFGEPGHGLIVGAVIMTLASIAGIAALVRQRGDHRLEALTLLLVAAMVAALGGAVFADPFNPYIGVLPLLLCMVAAWGVMSGHHRQLWVMVLAGSLAAQAHLSYVPLVASLVVLVSVSLGADVARGSGVARRRLTHRIIPATVLVGLAAWTGPLIDQIFGTQNLTRVVQSQSGERPARGMDHGLELAIEMTAMPPRWLLGRARSEVLGDPSAIRIAAASAAIGMVAVIGVWAFRRRDRGLASLSLVSLVSVAVATITSAREVNLDTPLLTLDGLLVYRMFWWPVGAVFLLAFTWGMVSLVDARRATDEAGHVRKPTVGALALPCLAICALLAPLGHRSPLETDALYAEGVQHARAIADLPGSPEVVVLRFWPEGRHPPHGYIPEFGLSAGLIAQLRLQGVAVRFPDEGGEEGTFVVAYRDQHRAHGDEPTTVLYRVGPDVDLDPPPGYRRISRSGPAPGLPLNPFDPLTAVYVRS